MDDFNHHLKLADDIYVASRQLDDLIDQSHKLKCTKKQFYIPEDGVIYSRYLLLGKTCIQKLAIYPCLFKCCMDSVVCAIDYKHPEIRAPEVYYHVHDRIQERDICFRELSDELFYTKNDIRIIRRIAERTVYLMDACISLYTGFHRHKRGYLSTMCKERDRIKNLII
jgi:hypothetical protein